MRHIEQQRLAQRRASDRMNYHPNFDAVSWVGKFEKDCAVAKFCRMPLRLGNLITDPPSRVESPMAQRSSKNFLNLSEDTLPEALNNICVQFPPSIMNQPSISTKK